MEFLVIGGTGLAGNALQKVRPDAICVSSKDYDLTKEVELKAMFEKYRSANVIHLAAKVGGIIDNMNHPRIVNIEKICVMTNCLI